MNLELIFVITIISLINSSDSITSLEANQILGIQNNKQSSVQEIRQTYKNLAKLWHPDKSDCPCANDIFVEINAAYKFLSQPKKVEKIQVSSKQTTNGASSPAQKPIEAHQVKWAKKAEKAKLAKCKSKCENHSKPRFFNDF